MDFQYHVQAYCIDDDELQLISSALDTFHANKQSILDCEAQRGKGNKVIDNWYISKLELMQSFVPSIKWLSIAIQWTADITDHAHVTEIKTPARASNNNNYNPQICPFLDQAEKCWVFELMTLICQKDLFVPLQDLKDVDHEIDKNERDNQDSDETESDITPTTSLASPPTNYFIIAIHLHSKDQASIPFPLHTFTVGSTAINLAYNPLIRHITVDEVAQRFSLPDLQPALADYLACESSYCQPFVHPVGGQHHASPTAVLPFNKLQDWFKVWI